MYKIYSYPRISTEGQIVRDFSEITGAIRQKTKILDEAQLVRESKEIKDALRKKKESSTQRQIVKDYFKIEDTIRKKIELSSEGQIARNFSKKIEDAKRKKKKLSSEGQIVRNFSEIEDAIRKKKLLNTIDNIDDCSYSVNKVIVGDSEVNIKEANKKADDSFERNIAAIKLCMEIEKNIESILYQLDGNIDERDSPGLITRKKHSDVFDQNGNKKRYRRKSDELTGNKNNLCPYKNCVKTYVNISSLILHLKNFHKEDCKIKEGKIIPHVKHFKIKMGVNINKIFKNPEALKQECKINLESDNTQNLLDKEENYFCNVMSILSV